MKFQIMLYFLGMIAVHSVSAQEKPLRVGDMLPEIHSLDVVNYESDVLQLSEFRGKLLILDFWATWCSPCLAAFPKMDSLQKQFENEVVILPVTYEDRDKIQSFYHDSGFSTRYDLPTIVGDTLLHRLFKHRTIPHLVWIDKYGKVAAVTGAKELVAKNISFMLDGRRGFLDEKIDGAGRLNDHVPVFALGNTLIQDSATYQKPVRDSSIHYYSILTKGDTPGIGGSMFRDSTRISYTNTSMMNLYKVAFSDFSWSFLNSKVVLELSDSSFMNSYKKGEAARQWLKSNGYTYELRVPDVLSSSMLKFMQQDLNRYFRATHGIEGRLEKRNTKCLILKSIGNNGMLITKGDASATNIDAYNISLINKDISWLTHRLTFTLQHLKMPIIDESGINFNVDINLKGKLSDTAAVNSALQPFNLKLVPEVRKRSVLVISDLN